jgi:hypothetical protein
MVQDCSILDREQSTLDDTLRKALRVILQGQDAVRFVEDATQEVLHERADIATLQRLMNLVLLKVYHEEVMTTKPSGIQRSDRDDAAPVYRAG